MGPADAQRWLNGVLENSKRVVEAERGASWEWTDPGKFWEKIGPEAGAQSKIGWNLSMAPKSEQRAPLHYSHLSSSRRL